MNKIWVNLVNFKEEKKGLSRKCSVWKDLKKKFGPEKMWIKKYWGKKNWVEKFLV